MITPVFKAHMIYNENWKEEGSDFMTKKVYIDKDLNQVPVEKINSLEFVTVIDSNGSTWSGQYEEDLPVLYRVLTESALDPTFEDYGNFCSSIDKHQWYQAKGMFRFFGNFFDLSHGFSIDTNDPDVIQKLTDLVCHNKKTPQYQDRLSEIKEEKRLKAQEELKQTFSPVTC